MTMKSEDWDAAERDIVALWSAGDTQQAIARIESVLSNDRGEFKGRALMYRGSIHKAQQNLEAAIDDFAEAVRLFDAGSYVRYHAELSLGRASQLLGDASTATKWYRSALETCESAIEPFSGSSALEGLLSMRLALTDTELTLMRSVIRKSWKLLEIREEPSYCQEWVRFQRPYVATGLASETPLLDWSYMSGADPPLTP